MCSDLDERQSQIGWTLVGGLDIFGWLKGHRLSILNNVRKHSSPYDYMGKKASCWERKFAAIENVQRLPFYDYPSKLPCFGVFLEYSRNAYFQFFHEKSCEHEQTPLILTSPSRCHLHAGLRKKQRCYYRENYLCFLVGGAGNLIHTITVVHFCKSQATFSKLKER